MQTEGGRKRKKCREKKDREVFFNSFFVSARVRGCRGKGVLLLLPWDKGKSRRERERQSKCGEDDRDDYGAPEDRLMHDDEEEEISENETPKVKKKKKAKKSKESKGSKRRSRREEVPISSPEAMDVGPVEEAEEGSAILRSDSEGRAKDVIPAP
ncbi:hypothetical protein F7725_025361 [Dissostichus mawsoni]|uniref:Uncharacterized protein n=1 Tax=Dissostichus mawsoni TaxID=36200 RepID=A0A7J5XC37_DISMA|nr:hypothetical protein F7725_025361 [Dissostichus mawsoni]